MTLARIFVFCIITMPLMAQQPFPDFDKYVEKGLSDWQIPGMSVAIIKDGKVIYAKGYGIQRVGENKKVDENTVFAIGSNTKAFTALGLMLLANERKLTLNDKVTQHLPNFRLYDTLATNEVTIRDLLCHRIGLGTWHGDLVAWGSDYGSDELIRRMRYIKPASSFRSRFGYSNTAFLTAGAVLSKISGKSWGDFITEKIFKPLNMTRTVATFGGLSTLENVAQPHTFYKDKPFAIPYRNIDNIAPAGSINSSALDLSKWLIAQMDTSNKIFKTSTLRETHSAQTIIPTAPYRNNFISSRHFSAYGLGWFLQDYMGKIIVQHSGGVDGMTSQTGFLPEIGLGFVILTNLDEHNFNTALMYQIIDAYLNAPNQNWNEKLLKGFREDRISQKEYENELLKEKTGKVALPLIDYTGIYEHPHYGTIEILYQNGQLRMNMRAHLTEVGALEPWNKNTFRCYFPDPIFGQCQLPFTVENGKVKGLRLLIRPDFLDPVEYDFVKK